MVEKRASLCSASACFLGVFGALKKVGLLPPKNLLAGRLGLDPLIKGIHNTVADATS